MKTSTIVIIVIVVLMMIIGLVWWWVWWWSEGWYIQQVQLVQDIIKLAIDQKTKSLHTESDNEAMEDGYCLEISHLREAYNNMEELKKKGTWWAGMRGSVSGSIHYYHTQLEFTRNDNYKYVINLKSNTPYDVLRIMGLGEASDGALRMETLPTILKQIKKNIKEVDVQFSDIQCDNVILSGDFDTEIENCFTLPGGDLYTINFNMQNNDNKLHVLTFELEPASEGACGLLTSKR